MQEYLHQLKVIADQLATCRAPVIEEDLILYTLSGLPSMYRPFQTSIRTRSCHDPVSLEELHTLLVCEELSFADKVTGDSSTAFVAKKSFVQTALQVPLLTNEIPLAHLLAPFGTLVLVQAQVLLLML
ncbi:hypothetical protein MRB53_034138 [Persea americana]|uniref:Uncharacterized protein n=1 Tax=Persea americana TaxID=3435 RepID=A0ACC2KWW0_PERAE|nr:hypothetical protein MRB53_034138 [Persea americana]